MEAVLADIAGLEPRPIVVVRSTMPVGTSQRLLRDGHVRDLARFFTVPEFLRQGSALADFAKPTRVVIGRVADADPDAEAVLVEVFGAFGGPLRLVTLEEAELIKNGANAFLALKISFANEMAGLAEQSGADVGPVLEAIGLDPRIGSTYLHPSFGFGGSCLPKELQTIATSGTRARARDARDVRRAPGQPRPPGSVRRAHRRHRRRRRRPADRAARARLQGRHRRHPVVARGPPGRLAARARGRVHAYDPAAAGTRPGLLPTLVTVESAIEALTGAEVAVIATEWPEFKELDWACARRDRMAVPAGHRWPSPARPGDDARPRLPLRTRRIADSQAGGRSSGAGSEAARDRSPIG